MPNYPVPRRVTRSAEPRAAGRRQARGVAEVTRGTRDSNTADAVVPWLALHLQPLAPPFQTSGADIDDRPNPSLCVWLFHDCFLLWRLSEHRGSREVCCVMRFARHRRCPCVLQYSPRRRRNIVSPAREHGCWQALVVTYPCGRCTSYYILFSVQETSLPAGIRDTLEDFGRFFFGFKRQARPPPGRA